MDVKHGLSVVGTVFQTQVVPRLLQNVQRGRIVIQFVID